MATGVANTMRLTFLYPHLFRSSVRGSNKASPVHTMWGATAGFHTSSRRSQQQDQHQRQQPHQDGFAPRVGSAVQPSPPSIAPKAAKPESKAAGSTEQAVKSKGKKHAADGQHSNRQKSVVTDNKAASVDEAATETQSSAPSESPLPPTQSKALETVLHMDPPSASSSSSSPPDGSNSSDPNHHKPPHLQATPYIHHFDTYTLVRDLERGGFTEAQSVTAMKAVRNLLALNLDVAKEGLVSKSDVENETYLFRAACSELRTEIQNSRASTTTKMRAERAQLQHEVDILNQKMTQESLSLKDGLKGMFDDRKMAVRMEQRAMESQIQELNYQITVSLNSDAKSEVEGLRWVLTRRAALAIVTMAFLILGSLRYTTYQMHLQELAQKRKHEGGSYAEASSQTGDDGGSSPRAGTGGETEMLASGGGRGGANPSYVSLG